MMPGKIFKADVRQVIQEMSGEDLKLDEFVGRLILLSKVRTGLDQTGEGVSHEDVTTEFYKPRGERKWNQGRISRR